MNHVYLIRLVVLKRLGFQSQKYMGLEIPRNVLLLECLTANIALEVKAFEICLVFSRA